MDWIKRNLIFVIGAVVALALLGLAGWYNYSGYSHNAEEKDKLNAGYEELKRLKALKPAPGEGKTDNIKLAKEQEKEAQEFIGKLTKRLQAIPALPEGTNLLAKDYSAALQRTIDELQRDATNNSVQLPPKYKFSFEAQAGRVTFAPGSLEALATQLGEVKVIAGILNQAKINALDGIRRERVSADDSTGPATDYIDMRSVTNELAILTPYEVTFRCFTPELAQVLTGFANSGYGLIVKGINIETAPPMFQTDASGIAAGGSVVSPVYMPAQVQPNRYGGEGGATSDAFRSRYGAPRAMSPTPAPAPIPVAVSPSAPVKTGLQPFLSEKQMKATVLIHAVKLLPAK